MATKPKEPVASAVHDYDFVCMGLRETVNGDKCMKIGKLAVDDKTTIIEEMLFKATKIRRVVGVIYTGAKFSATSSKGLDTAKMAGRWYNRNDVAEWEGLEASALASMAATKLEKDAGRVGEIDGQMRKLRATYSAAMERGDMATCRALEGAVLQSLRRPLRSHEQ